MCAAVKGAAEEERPGSDRCPWNVVQVKVVGQGNEFSAEIVSGVYFLSKVGELSRGFDRIRLFFRAFPAGKGFCNGSVPRRGSSGFSAACKSGDKDAQRKQQQCFLHFLPSKNAFIFIFYIR